MDQKFPTTVDNPYNYFSQFDDWYAYDMSKGYNTCSYLARIVDKVIGIPTDPSESEVVEAINKATDEIVRMNINGMYTTAMNTNKTAPPGGP